MKVKELQEKSAEELKKLLNDQRTKLCQLRFDMKTRQLKNYRDLPTVKKDIARILTILKIRN